MPKDLRTKTLRNQTKAYDMEDQLKPEYSISLLGKRYPLLTKTMKGFTSKASKSGKTRFNKLFNAHSSIKQEYINAVNTALNMHDATAKTAVGDDTKNPNVSSKGQQKQEKDITLHSKLAYDKAPESVAVFNEDKKQDEEKAEEPQLQTSQAERQQANVIEKRQEQQQQQQQDISEIASKIREEQAPPPMPKPKRTRRKKKEMQESRAMSMEDVDAGGLETKERKKRAKKKMKGGMLEGASHDNGGIEIEAEGGEYVINKESTKHFEKELKKMNDAGNDLRDTKEPQLRRRKMKKINQMKRKMRKGGMLKYRNGGKIYANGGMVSEIEQPSTGGGLMGQLSRDDGTADKGLYQELINKFFTKMDFTQTLKYIQNKNRDVESMAEDALRSKAEEIAQQVKVQLKYNGNSLSLLKNQVYELMAIRLAMQQQPKKSSQQGNVGLVVDMESVFGDGAEVDKQAFAQKYMRGGKIDKEQVKEDMEQPEDLENIVAQGKEGDMTQPKPEQKKAFQDFQSLSAGGQSEGAISRGESSYTRRTFNLPMALNGSVELGWRQRYAQEIDENNEQFKKPSIFKYRKKNTKKGRRNLLS